MLNQPQSVFSFLVAKLDMAARTGQQRCVNPAPGVATATYAVLLGRVPVMK